MRKFNVTGLCVPQKHYMADTGEKIAGIMALIDDGEYFSINCPRQYGKTTTLNLIEKGAPKDYIVIKLSFEAVGDAMFEDEKNFARKFIERCADAFERGKRPEAKAWKSKSVNGFETLSKFLSKTCCGKKYVLIIDEVDKSSNNRLFLKFLGMLRDKFLARNAGDDDTFHTVILAGVYNIKNLKIKMVQAGTHQLQDGEKRQNSPWNIAIDFNIDMSLSVKEIASMLIEYENDHKTGMNIDVISQEIRAYTNGYPYLVSKICKTIDETLKKNWTVENIAEAIRIMRLEQGNTLKDDFFHNLNNDKDLCDMMKNIVINGEKYKYNDGSITQQLGLTFGFIVRQDEFVVVGNRFFEILLYRHFTTEKSMRTSEEPNVMPSEVISSGRLDMPLLIEKFAWHYHEIYRGSEKKFIESECRLLFITYLQAMINGNGHYYIEAETRDRRRMDIIADYAGEQFIIELKLWYGEAAREKAVEQLCGYLESKNKSVGYLLTFDFRKEENTGAPKMVWTEHGGKKIFDCAVGV